MKKEPKQKLWPTSSTKEQINLLAANITPKIQSITIYKKKIL